MKHTNKKGFTIVELVIVIAVIAILAAVLIPNLSRLVTKADKSAAMQEAKAAMDNDLINAEGALENMVKFSENNKQYYVVTEFSTAPSFENGKTYFATYTKTDGTATTTKVSTAVSDAKEGTTVTYYEVSAFNGFFTVTNQTTGEGKYEITCKDFKCTFENGEWTVADKT